MSTEHLVFGWLFLGAGVVLALIAIGAWLKAMLEMAQQREWVWFVFFVMIPLVGIGYVGWTLTK